MIKKFLLLGILLLAASPSFAWVNMNDPNWKMCENNFEKYYDKIQTPKYDYNIIITYLNDSISALQKADVDKKTKKELTAYLSYLFVIENYKYGYYSLAKYLLFSTKMGAKGVITKDNQLNLEVIERLKLSLTTPKPTAEELKSNKSKNKTINQLQSAVETKAVSAQQRENELISTPSISVNDAQNGYYTFKTSDGEIAANSAAQVEHTGGYYTFKTADSVAPKNPATSNQPVSFQKKESALIKSLNYQSTAEARKANAATLVETGKDKLIEGFKPVVDNVKEINNSYNEIRKEYNEMKNHY